MSRQQGRERGFVAPGDESREQLLVTQPRECPLAEERPGRDIPADGVWCSFAMFADAPDHVPPLYSRGPRAGPRQVSADDAVFS